MTKKFKTEFNRLNDISCTQDHKFLEYQINEEIAQLNRYNNIIPYKHSAVQIKQFESEGEGYINANHITTTFGETNKLIATQGPLDNTIPSFWKMILQENVELILMLCNTLDKGKKQCSQYWPDPSKQLTINTKQNFIIIQCIEEKLLGYKIVQRKILVKYQGKEKIIIQLHWQEWPDFGAPLEKDFPAIYIILPQLLETYLDEKSKIAFHCSAGVGRTGTLIGLFNLILSFGKQLQDYQTTLAQNQNSDQFRLSIFGTVRRIRECRFGMIQTDLQYEFLYKFMTCLLYTSPSPRDRQKSRMPSSA
eukprot:TRINITY_DN3625_c0_g1_i3.p2 TRINITY_DN3625_c0_g1~~TRINITY_DN3625_c0_g1_i3.p2  ORF type:complete len:306 (+),score=56.75 TRINITY_DN3625_c0_g1_i3:325-1242(+)